MGNFTIGGEELQDQNIDCIDCHNKFVFTASEQKFYSDRDYEKPKRCKVCRAAKRKRMEMRNQNQ